MVPERWFDSSVSIKINKNQPYILLVQLRLFIAAPERSLPINFSRFQHLRFSKGYWKLWEPPKGLEMPRPNRRPMEIYKQPSRENLERTKANIKEYVYQPSKISKGKPDKRISRLCTQAVSALSFAFCASLRARRNSSKPQVFPIFLRKEKTYCFVFGVEGLILVKASKMIGASRM